MRGGSICNFLNFLSNKFNTLRAIKNAFGCRGDEEEEDYDFEYSDEGEEDTDVDLENSYYSAKALKTEDPKAAVEAFREARRIRVLPNASNI